MKNIILENKIHINAQQSSENMINFMLCNYKDNYKFEHLKLNYYTVIFLLKGKIQIYNANRGNKTVLSNQFYLVGKNTVAKGTVSKDSEVLIMQFDHISYDPIKVKFQNFRNQLTSKNYTLCPLDANRQIRIYIEQLKDILVNQIDCQHYIQGKVNELFLILQLFYTTDELFTFCYPLITNASSFKEMILQYSLKTNSLKELQQYTGLSTSTFNRKFKAEFNDSAYQWLLKQKAGQIKLRLMNESITLSDIIREFGFHSHSHLQKYCKTHFNMNPSELKKTLRRSD
ncbi:MAG TPA: hypothetical protein DCF91_09755 [Porphyromonadaceae bacterium]|nr:hypothetical protein [Porphyromonadaceae bacterium]